MRILITGSEGVLGSTLKQELRRRGHNVFGLDLTHSADPQVMRADISERRQLTRAFDLAAPEIVFHFAAEFGRKNGEEYFEQLWYSNCIGTQNVIEECVRVRAVMVFASSSEAYGISEDYSQDRSLHEGMLDEVVPRFHNQYALSKYTNERQIQIAVRNHGLRAVILRMFNVYGPPERYSPFRSVVCQFAYKLLNGDPVTVNREGRRSHLWIGDWANTVAGIPERLNLILNIPIWPGSGRTPYLPVFNIGGDTYESIPELYVRLTQIVPTRAEDVFVDAESANTATKLPSHSAARQHLDHYPKMSIDQGLRLTVDFLRREYGL